MANETHGNEIMPSTRRCDRREDEAENERLADDQKKDNSMDRSKLTKEGVSKKETSASQKREEAIVIQLIDESSSYIDEEQKRREEAIVLYER